MTQAEHPQTAHVHSFVLQQGSTCRCGAVHKAHRGPMTEHPAAPTTRPGDLDEKGIADLRKVFPGAIARIEAEARAAARKEVLDEPMARLIDDHQRLADVRQYVESNRDEWSDDPSDRLAMAYADIFQKVLNVIDTGHPMLSTDTREETPEQHRIRNAPEHSEEGWSR